jgi:hypothetical protein
MGSLKKFENENEFHNPQIFHQHLKFSPEDMTKIWHMSDKWRSKSFSVGGKVFKSYCDQGLRSNWFPQ